MDFGNIMVEDEVKYYQETFGVKEPWKIPTHELEDCSYKDIRRIDDEFRELREDNDKLHWDGVWAVEDMTKRVKQHEKVKETNTDLRKVIKGHVKEKSDLISLITGNPDKYDEVKEILKNELSEEFYDSISSGENPDADPLGLFG
jgi:hypothetical protein